MTVVYLKELTPARQVIAEQNLLSAISKRVKDPARASQLHQQLMGELKDNRAIHDTNSPRTSLFHDFNAQDNQAIANDPAGLLNLNKINGEAMTRLVGSEDHQVVKPGEKIILP